MSYERRSALVVTLLVALSIGVMGCGDNSGASASDQCLGEYLAAIGDFRLGCFGERFAADSRAGKTQTAAFLSARSNARATQIVLLQTTLATPGAAILYRGRV